MEFKEAFNPIRSLKSTFKTMGLAPGALWGGGIFLMILELLSGLGLAGFNWALQTDTLSGINPYHWEQTIPGPLGTELKEWFLESSAIAYVGGALIALSFLMASARVFPGVLHKLRDVHQSGSSEGDSVFADRGLFGLVLKLKLLLLLLGLLLSLPIFFSEYVEARINSDGNPDLSLDGLLISSGITLAWLVPYCYVIFGISFVLQSTIYEGLQPGDALKRSWALMRGNRWRYFVFFLFQMLITLCGYLMCCVGVFATGALGLMMQSEAFLQLTSQEGSPEPS
ncbi:MAG: hypothetical protein MK291_04495 [Planctomycetes bacterium]|nr:hypothetical protein [Planctomycetota bacterium]